MKKAELPQGISLVFSHDAEPGRPVELNRDALRKLGELPRVIKALAESYGPSLGQPTLSGGTVHLKVLRNSMLFDVTGCMQTDLVTTAQELSVNAQRQPPLPLAQATTHRYCVEALHALAQAREKSGLVATLCVGDHTFELPHVPLADFTEPETDGDRRIRINQTVMGLCIPHDDVNVILLENVTIVELSIEHYPYSLESLERRIFHETTNFSGWACLIKKGVLRAEPGGELISQKKL